MSSRIEKIVREANATFSKGFTHPDFTDNFNKLVKHVDELKKSDLNVSESMKTVPGYVKHIFPCLYMEVFATETFLIGIYILKSDVQKPLHDHPGMYGILKVIEGGILVVSYTSVADELGNKEVPEDVKNKVERSQRNSAAFIPVTHESIVVVEESEPCVLRPKEGNFHKIYTFSTRDTSVYLHVTAPPYDMDERKCNFYEALESEEQDAAIKTWLVKTHPAGKFYSTAIPYCGPKIKL